MPFDRQGKIIRKQTPKSPVVERVKAKLPARPKKIVVPPKDDKITGLFVTGKHRYDSDGETLIIPLSRTMSPDEQTAVKDAVYSDCAAFVRLIHIRGATVRLRLRDNSGEPLCERQVEECIRRAIRHL